MLFVLLVIVMVLVLMVCGLQDGEDILGTVGGWTWGYWVSIFWLRVRMCVVGGDGGTVGVGVSGVSISGL